MRVGFRGANNFLLRYVKTLGTGLHATHHHGKGSEKQSESQNHIFKSPDAEMFYVASPVKKNADPSHVNN
jgi:hypothetical protein